MIPADFRKYFSKLTEVAWLPVPPLGSYANAVVIPVLGEGATLPTLLKQITQFSRDTLTILVVNDSDDTPLEHKLDNQNLLKNLTEQSSPNTFWLDCTNNKLSPAGVGSARKIGMDAACQVLNDPSKIIFCLDGDTQIEANYFSAITEYLNDNPKIPACCVKFAHYAETKELETAANYYDQYLQNWQNGLAYAGSPYAFIAMGSAMAVKCWGYVKCGGMRKNSGGEDFYFLQAVRKLGEIGNVSTTTVHPAARLSDRVPFGTGPRLKKILQDDGIMLTPQWVFEELKQLLEPVNSSENMADLINLYDTYKAILSPQALAFLEERNFDEKWQRIVKNSPKDLEHLKLAFMTWFDGFQTLKFINSLLGSSKNWKTWQ